MNYEELEKLAYSFFDEYYFLFHEDEINEIVNNAINYYKQNKMYLHWSKASALGMFLKRAFFELLSEQLDNEEYGLISRIIEHKLENSNKNMTLIIEICSFLDSIKSDNVIYVLEGLLINKDIYEIIRKNISDDYLCNTIINTSKKSIILLYKLYTKSIEFPENNIKKLATDNANNCIQMTESLKQYIKDVNKIEVLSNEDQIRLALKYKAGDKEAGKRLVESNLRYVIKLARKFSNEMVSTLDLIQEGNIGLMKALEKFDPSKGVGFLTYAHSIVFNEMLNFLHEKSRMIHYSYHASKKVLDLRKIKDKTNLEKIEDIANYLGVSSDKIKSLYNLPYCDVSLDTDEVFLCPNGKEKMVSEYLYSDEDIEEEIATKIEYEDIRKIIDSSDLSNIEIDILNKRIMCDPKDKVTLGEIAKTYGCTGENIRLYEKKLINKLKTKILKYYNSNGIRYKLK